MKHGNRTLDALLRASFRNEDLSCHCLNIYRYCRAFNDKGKQGVCHASFLNAFAPDFPWRIIGRAFI